MRIKLIPLAIAAFILAGSWSSCKKQITEPQTDTTHKKCDTCNTDTTHHPCDTCNINKDSAAHAFVWKEYINPTTDADNHFSGVWVFGPNDMIIVGDRLWHFDGTTFTPIEAINNTHHTSMDGGLSGLNIFAFSKTDYWLVSGSIAFHTTDGKYFDDNRKGGVNACWGTSSSDMFFVGNAGNVFHYDGTNFTNMTSNTTKDLRSVWGTSHNDVWACGFNSSTGGTILLHYDGNTWSEDAISIKKGIVATGGFDAVWACDSAGHKFVSTSGAILIRKTDNGLWRSDSGLIPNGLGGGSFIGISPFGNNANDMMAVGPWGFIAHWNGKTWKKYDELYDYSNNIYYGAAFSMLGNTACVVGTKSGQKWIAVGTRK